MPRTPTGKPWLETSSPRTTHKPQTWQYHHWHEYYCNSRNKRTSCSCNPCEALAALLGATSYMEGKHGKDGRIFYPVVRQCNLFGDSDIRRDLFVR